MHVCSIRLACVETVLCSKKVFAEYVDVYLCHVLAPPSGKLQVAVAAMLHFIRQMVFIVFSRWCFGIRQPFSTIIPTANKPLLLPLACPGGWSFSAHLFGASEAASVLMDSVLVVLTGLLGTNPSLRKGGKTRKLMRKKHDFRVRFSLEPIHWLLTKVNAPHTQGIYTYLGSFRGRLI